MLHCVYRVASLQDAPIARQPVKTTGNALVRMGRQTFSMGNVLFGFQKTEKTADVLALKNPLFAAPHTHWDIEWHSTESTFTHRLVAGMDNMLAQLEQGKIPHFTFDGQTAPLERYLQLRPEN